jgi:hypothetical protein
MRMSLHHRLWFWPKFGGDKREDRIDIDRKVLVWRDLTGIGRTGHNRYYATFLQNRAAADLVPGEGDPARRGGGAEAEHVDRERHKDDDGRRTAIEGGRRADGIAGIGADVRADRRPPPARRPGANNSGLGGALDFGLSDNSSKQCQGASGRCPTLVIGRELLGIRGNAGLFKGDWSLMGCCRTVSRAAHFGAEHNRFWRGAWRRLARSIIGFGAEHGGRLSLLAIGGCVFVGGSRAKHVGVWRGAWRRLARSMEAFGAELYNKK